MPRVLSALPAAILCCVTLASATVAAQTAETEADTPAEVTAPTADTALVTVNGTEITLGEVIAVRQTLPDEYQEFPDEVLVAALLQQMQDQQLLADAGKQAGLDKSRSVVLALLNQERAVLADAYMAQEIIARVTPEAIQAKYQEIYVDVGPKQEIRLAHIVVESEEKAAEISAQLEARGDFAALAAEYSLDQAASQGGDLNWRVVEQMPPSFIAATDGLDIGERTGPVQTPFGWHIIRLDGRRDQAVPPLEAVEGQIIGMLRQEAETAILEEVRASADIVSPDPAVPAGAVRQDSLIAN